MGKGERLTMTGFAIHLYLRSIPDTSVALRVMAVIMILVYHHSSGGRVHNRHTNGATIANQFIIEPCPPCH